jgi:hypothetical protein
MQAFEKREELAAVNRVSFLMIVSIFFLGFAQILILPPWEGFDEIAHWSSIQQLADTGRVPVWGSARMSADRLSYAGPEPVGVDARGRTYADLRSLRAADFATGPHAYKPEATRLNWQAQHPPLYYALMVPVYRAAHGLDWVHHLMVLRIVSWTMAVAGLVLGVQAIQASAGSGAPFGLWTTPLTLTWPFIFAGFFADLARLGNDGLCLLLFGAVLKLLLPMLDGRAGSERPTPVRALSIGLLLAAGLWTKAFFGPISIGVLGLLAARAWKARSPRLAVDAVLAVGIAWIIGAGWYLMKFRTTGSLVGSDEESHLIQAGGLLRGLAAHFSVKQFERGLAEIGVTIGWVGTWSLARISTIAMAPVALLLLALGLSYLSRLRRYADQLFIWAPAALVGPMILGLVYHVLIRIAIDGSGSGTPGWYLHVVSPMLGLMLALGWTRPRLFSVLALYSMGYTALSWVGQVGLFSGCVSEDATKHYDFAHAQCLSDLHGLGLIGSPWLALTSLFAACLAAGSAAAIWLKARPQTALEDELQPILPLHPADV